MGGGVSLSARPLQGRRVLLTRRSAQASTLKESLTALGATVLEAPTIDVVPPDDFGPLDAALRGLAAFDWVLFTSANAVRFVADRMRAVEVDPKDLSTRRIGSVGPATTRALNECFPGIHPPIEPAADFRAEGLADALRDLRGLRVLLPTSDRARDALPKALCAQGARVEVVLAYKTVTSGETQDQLAAWLDLGVDLAVFASPSAVQGFVDALGERARGVPAAVIGPVTELAARGAGLEVRAVASPSTTEGLVSAILASAQPSHGQG